MSHMCNEAERTCSQGCNVNKADLIIIMDSSSSVKEKNFNLMRNFVQSLISAFRIGEGFVHVGIIRYNEHVDVRRWFNASQDMTDVVDDVRNIPYRGRGTHTGKAIQYSLDHLFKEANGMRSDEVPKILITITDGQSSDQVLPPSQAVRASGITTYGIGIGKVDVSEVTEISGEPTRTFMATTFAELGGSVLEQIKESLCTNVDECRKENGGCSHQCRDTDGSYYCECPEDFLLSEDLKTCLPIVENPDKTAAYDECAHENGGCSHDCIDTLEAFFCGCPPTMLLEADNKTCSKINECKANPCEKSCVDIDAGFYCECPPTEVLRGDGLSCKARDTINGCNSGWTKVGQTCAKLVSGEFTYADGAAGCAAMGARLVTVPNQAHLDLMVGLGWTDAWIGAKRESQNAEVLCSDGSMLAIPFDDSPYNPYDCVMVASEGTLTTLYCGSGRDYICEQPRLSSEVIYETSWANGANVMTYWVTGSDFIKLEIPTIISHAHSWNCEIVKLEGNGLILSQNSTDITRNQPCMVNYDGRERLPVGALGVLQMRRYDIEEKNDTDYSYDMW